jgi:hypothetical protein
VNASPVTGKPEAQVKLPGSNTFIPLDQAQDLPKGTIISVTGDAEIELQDATGHVMVFYGVPDGVPSQFIFQGVVNGVVQLQLTGGNFSKFGRKVSTISAKPKKPKKPVRRLWGSGKGKFTTKGKYASATVRGTNWLVADYSDHTQVTVKRGLVAVKNFVTGKTVLVPAGHTVVINAKKPKTKTHK